MALPEITRYPFDPTGKSPQNLVYREPHDVPSGKVNKVFCLNYGPFYREGVVVTDLLGNDLQLDKDYTTEWMYPEATSDTGKEVVGFLKFNENIQGSVYVTYQVVGGQYGIQNSQVLYDILEAIINDNRPIYWDNILGKPDKFPPSPHTHPTDQITSWQQLIDIINQINYYVTEGATDSLSDLYARVASLQAYVDMKNTDMQTILDNHINNSNNPHNDTKEDVGLGNVDNFATANDQQTIDGLRSDLFVTPHGVSAKVTQEMNNITNNVVHQGIVPISMYGNSTFLNPGVNSTFQGFNMINVNDAPYHLFEKDGSLVRLRPGTNGSEIGVYYDYIVNSYRNPLHPDFTYTTQRYNVVTSISGTEYIPYALIPTGDGIIAGLAIPKSNQNVANTVIFITLLDRTLSGGTGKKTLILPRTISMPFGTEYLNPTQTRFDITNGQLWMSHISPGTCRVANGAGVNYSQTYINIGYWDLNAIINQTSTDNLAFPTFLNHYDINVLGVNQSGTTYPQVNLGFIGTANDGTGWAKYTGTGNVTFKVSPLTGCNQRIVYDPATSKYIYTLGVVITASGNNNTVTCFRGCRFAIDVANKKITNLDNVKSLQLGDEDGKLKFTDVNNNTGLNTNNLLYTIDPIISPEGTSTYRITKTGYVYSTTRYDATNSAMYFRVFKITNFNTTTNTIDDVMIDPAGFTYQLVSEIQDIPNYPTSVKGNIRMPIAFNDALLYQVCEPDGSLKYYRELSSSYPANIDSYTYNVFMYGSVKGFSPTDNKIPTINTLPVREIITETTTLGTTTHSACISSHSPIGPQQVDSYLSFSGSINVDITELTNTATAFVMSNLSSITPTVDSISNLDASLYVPNDPSIPLMMLINVVGISGGVYHPLSFLAKVNYAGSRSDTISGFTIDSTNFFVNYDSTTTCDVSLLIDQQAPGLVFYKRSDNTWMYAISSFACFNAESRYIAGVSSSLYAMYVGTIDASGTIAVNSNNGFKLEELTYGYITHTYTAIPNKGMLRTKSFDFTTGLENLGDKSLNGFLCGVVTDLIGEDLAIFNGTTASTTSYMLSSLQINKQWNIYFTDNETAVMGGNEYIMPVKTVDLRSIAPDPTNKTFYVYIEIDNGSADYNITLDTPPETLTTMYIGFITTNSTTIDTIAIQKPIALDTYRLSEVQVGSAISVSSGLPMDKGLWRWMDGRSLTIIGTTVDYWGTTPPPGTLEANGGSFDTTMYPELAKVFPSGVLPDLRGYFVRSRGGNAAAVGVHQDYANDGHTHAYSGTTSGGTSHTHTYAANPVNVHGGAQGGNRESNGPQTRNTDPASDSGGTYSGTTAATTGAAVEVRPINKSCWKLFEAK